MKKLLGLAAAGALVAALALTGCSSSSSSASASASASGSQSEASGVVLVEPNTLIVALSPDYPPFENLENGEIVGFDVDLAYAIGQKLGYTVKLQSMNFDAILTAVAGGGQVDVGISGFSIDPERAKTVDFSSSYYIDDLAIATMKDGSFADAEALKAEGVRIAVQSGTTGESYIQENYPNAQVIPFTNSNDCFAAMAANQADAVCTNNTVVKNMVSVSYTDAAIIVTVASGEEYGVAIAKDNPELTVAINSALEEMKEDGTLDALLNKWF